MLCLTSVLAFYQFKGSEPPKNTVACVNPSLIGDNVCDKALDIGECQFDGGDCLCQNGEKDRKECLGLSECDKDELVGNGFCNDETNVQKCAFDGGDCCLEAIKVRDCKECICKTTGLKHRKKGVVERECPVPDSHVGDGLCNDWANIKACSHDGGDCCLPVINKDQCIGCKCHNATDTDDGNQEFLDAIQGLFHSS